MKKILLPLVTLLLASFLLISIAQAVSVSVTAIPKSIIPGGSTTITVACDEDASGSITVRTPSNTPYSETIEISAGDSVSVIYPDDFTGAGSIEIGQYEVTVDLGGREFMATFHVSFEVHTVPEIPLVGTAGATVAMLSGLGLFVVKKRRPK